MKHLVRRTNSDMLSKSVYTRGRFYSGRRLCVKRNFRLKEETTAEGFMLEDSILTNYVRHRLFFRAGIHCSDRLVLRLLFCPCVYAHEFVEPLSVCPDVRSPSK